MIETRFTSLGGTILAQYTLYIEPETVFNVTISNVHGPPVALYSAGAKLEANFPLGPIFDGAALNITLVSYDGTLFLGINTDRAAVTDPDRLVACLETSFDELIG